MLRSARAFLALSLVVGLVPLLIGQIPATPKRYALVVGINEYEHGNLAVLKVAENDARVLAKELEALGYHVVRLLGKEATKAVIEKQLRTVCDQARKGDLVLVALSGHGMQFVERDVAYFCPVEGRPFADRVESLVSMATVYANLEASLATDRLLLIDACRNDPGVRGRSGIDAKSAPVPFGVAALYGCAPGQKAHEDEKLGHGLFMHSVLAGLRGAARHPETGEVTFASLAAYTQRQTRARAATLPGAPQQTPTLEARVALNPVLVAGSLPRIDSGEVPPKKPGEKADRAAFLRDTLRDAINKGAEVYNQGDHAGCYQFYRATLIVIRPSLSDYPELQEAIDKGLPAADQREQTFEKAFAARAILDKIRDQLKSKASDEK